MGMHVMPSFVLYARILIAHSLRRNCPKLRRSDWAVGTHAWIQPQKGERKPSFPIQSDRFLQVLIFGIALNLLTLHAPQGNNPNK